MDGVVSELLLPGGSRGPRLVKVLSAGYLADRYMTASRAPTQSRMQSGVQHLSLQRDDLPLLSIPVCEDLGTLSSYADRVANATILSGADVRDELVDLIGPLCRAQFVIDYYASTGRHALFERAVHGAVVTEAVDFAVKHVTMCVLQALREVGAGSDPLAHIARAAYRELNSRLRESGDRDYNGTPEHAVIFAFERRLRLCRLILRPCLPHQRVRIASQVLCNDGWSSELQARPYLEPVSGWNAVERSSLPADSATYWDVVERGLKPLCEAADILSIGVFGSLARATVRSGISDLCDAVVVLRDEALAGAVVFRDDYSALLTSARNMKQKGIPFHAFEYLFADEWMNHMPPSMLSEWADGDRSTRVLSGVDMRPSAGSTYSSALCQLYRAKLAPLLLEPLVKGSPREDANAMASLAWITDRVSKLLPKWTCQACGVWAPQVTAADLLQTLPGCGGVSLIEMLGAASSVVREKGIYGLPHELLVQAAHALYEKAVDVSFRLGSGTRAAYIYGTATR